MRLVASSKDSRGGDAGDDHEDGREVAAEVGVWILNWSRNGFLYSTGLGTHYPPSSASQLPS